MGFKIEKTDQYWKCLEEAYNPDLSKKRAKELLEGFLYFKSKTVSQQSGTPKKAEDAIIHLQSVLGSGSDKTSKGALTIFFEHPIISAFIAGIFILVVWQFLGPYFGTET
ncbi:hypothetical protein [Colwellia sp. RSH04]|uniref:hypothetical protein n=1 Tax=Colwellia sp. RSH04 TaxID=2305464 RepID=UPI000E58696D|nr:hypothetical protein [Colwellia sp. RSH04]RHW74586.1 hypothetical protein D1094_18150 [Colwellia sp. RSH04]